MDYNNQNAPMAQPVIIQDPPRVEVKKGGGFLPGCLCGCAIAALLPVVFFIGLIVLFACDNDATSITNKNSGAIIREGSGDQKVAVISINGIIGHFGNDSIFSETLGGDASRIIKELRKVSEDDGYAAVILDMNTPGGEVVAGDEVRKELDKLDIPVVTCMHSMAASGGYYIASGSDWIVANPMTLTGSIGVIMSGLQYKGLLDKIGVKPMVYRSGAFKDIGNGAREATPEEEAYLNGMIQEDFMHFCQVVSNGRKEFYPTAEDVAKSEAGDGRPISGENALRLHLIDELGDFDAAVAKARELGHCPDAPVVNVTAKNPFDRFFASMLAPKPANAKIQVEGLPTAKTLPMGNRFYLYAD